MITFGENMNNFQETDKSFVTRAKDSLKTARDILNDILSKSYLPEIEIRHSLYDVEKKIREGLDHLENV